MNFILRPWMVLLFFVLPVCLNSRGLSLADALHHRGEYEASYRELKKLAVRGGETDPALGWRLARALFVIAQGLPGWSVTEKERLYDEALLILEACLERADGKSRDVSALFHWYATIKSFKALSSGFFNAINQLPDLLVLNDLAIEADPTYSAPYFFRATYYKVLPAFLGGSKQKMGDYYVTALAYSPDSVHILIDTAKALYQRNWKKSYVKYAGVENSPVPAEWTGMPDRQLALLLLDKAILLFENDPAPSKHDSIKIEEAYRLLPGWKR